MILWDLLRRSRRSKICLLVHKCLYGKAPKCLRDMLNYVGSTRTMKLLQPNYKGSFGSRCFGRVGPKLWNLLPLKLRLEKDVVEFKKQLKTFLFDGFHDFEQKINERWNVYTDTPLIRPHVHSTRAVPLSPRRTHPPLSPKSKITPMLQAYKKFIFPLKWPCRKMAEVLVVERSWWETSEESQDVMGDLPGCWSYWRVVRTLN